MKPDPDNNFYRHDLQTFIIRMMSKKENKRPNQQDITHFVFMLERLRSMEIFITGNNKFDAYEKKYGEIKRIG